MAVKLIHELKNISFYYLPAFVRAAATVSTSSISLTNSLDSINNQKKALWDEANATWDLGKLLGLSHGSKDHEVVCKILELEEKDTITGVENRWNSFANLHHGQSTYRYPTSPIPTGR
ncbi:hypothetical protein F0562_002928 [Nyssa sinensis]|uniref:Uncharacterized protein n=1 Tax=Nyssa sinensis TaxID=561372 RepID=A0A5J5BTC1_9ASTE|nr:hypothetical protein F0562_002928 [Nyssa sinensis]